jgi:hypothetical protein
MGVSFHNHFWSMSRSEANCSGGGRMRRKKGERVSSGYALISSKVDENLMIRG